MAVTLKHLKVIAGNRLEVIAGNRELVSSLWTSVSYCLDVDHSVIEFPWQERRVEGLSASTALL